MYQHEQKKKDKRLVKWHFTLSTQIAASVKVATKKKYKKKSTCIIITTYLKDLATITFSSEINSCWPHSQHTELYSLSEHNIH